MQTGKIDVVGKFIFLMTAFLFGFCGITTEEAIADDIEYKASDQAAAADAKEAAAMVKSADNSMEVVITGKRSKEDPFKADRSISLVDSDKLKQSSPRTTPEALWDSPGTFVQQTNNGGGSPIVRGMIGPQVLILYDGIRLSNSVYRTGPIQYLNLIDPYSLDRLEVLRGPGSVLYGSDAVGGVIQAIPLAPRDFRSEGALGGGGSILGRYSSADNGRTIHGHADVGYGGFSFLGGVTYKLMDDLKAGGDIGEQVYSGYNSLSAIGNISYRLSEGFFAGWKISAGYMLAIIEDAGRTDKLYDKNSLQIYDNDDHLVYTRLHMVFPSIETSGDLTLSYQNFFERKDGISVADDYRTQLSTTRDSTYVDTLGLDLQMVSRFLENRMRLRYGGMFYHDWVDAKRTSRQFGGVWKDSEVQTYPDGSTYSTYGLYALLEGEPLKIDSSHTLRLSAGARLHGVNAHAQEQETLPAVDFSNLGVVFLAGMQYLYADNFNASFTFSQGFRAPNLQETVMLGDSGKFFHIPNDGLDPERADTLELLMRGNVWRVTAQWTGYITFLDDLIKRVGAEWEGQKEIDGKEVAQNVNGGTGRLWGTEGMLRIDIYKGLSLSGHLTYTWGEEDVPEENNIPLTRIPPLFGMASLRYDSPKAHGWVGYMETYLRFAAEQDRLSREDEKDVRIPDGGTPGWWTWNIRAGATIYDHLRLGVNVENLLDKKYKYHGSGLYSPGVNAILTLEAFID